jgi:hypothetical protein
MSKSMAEVILEGVYLYLHNSLEHLMGGKSIFSDVSLGNSIWDGRVATPNLDFGVHHAHI